MRTGGDVAWAAGRWRVAPAVCLALALGCATSGPIASRDRGPEIRVLLGAGLGSVTVDGRSVDDEKRFRGPGPHEVDGRRVRGAVEVSRGADGLRVVNELPLEDSIAGTVLGANSESWGPALLDDLVLVGPGRGHGVGMSQWGARALASQGASWPQILARFDPGARIERASRADLAAPVGAAP